MSDYALTAAKGFDPAPEDGVLESIFKQYESVIISSLITSFGLDFLVGDRHGGDVDTIHNVRQIGKDEKMTYKNAKNQQDYDNRGDYNSHDYHSHKDYIAKNREASQKKKEGNLTDAYTGDRIAPNEKSDMDHVISAKEIHDDRGRVLAEMSGTDLANSDDNLASTNPHTNRSKKADTMDDFLEKHGDEYTEEQKERMRQKDKEARDAYEKKLAKAYYTSPKFAKDMAAAAGKVGAKMGLRQALGFVFAEMWFAVKEEFAALDVKFGLDMDLGNFFTALGRGIKRGFENAKNNYKKLFEQFINGAVSGALSSITTTLCNIFFTTAKNVVKIIRQTWVSIVDATKILFVNPDNLPFGERMRAATKVLATGVSVVLGGLVSEAIGKTPVGAIPVIGDIVQTFCGSLVTGILSCTMLYFLDRSALVNKLVNFLNGTDKVNQQADFYRMQAELLDKYAAELMKIDIDTFRKETEKFRAISGEIETAVTEEELNRVLKSAYRSLGLNLPWEGTHDSFDSFMRDKTAVLKFS